MPKSLVIIGAGRLGRALGRRLCELGWRIGAVVTRSEPSARRAVRFIGAGKACVGMTRQILASRVILIAAPDDEIAIIAQELERIGEEELRGRVVLHTSGTMGCAVRDAVHERGAMVGSMHPLPSFSGVSVPSLEGKVFTIEGGNAGGPSVAADRAVARRIACAHRGKQENPVSHDSGNGRRSCARGGGSRQALAPLAWNEPERSPARVVAPDAPGSGEFRNVRAHAPRGWNRFRAEYKVVRAHLGALQESPEEFARAYEALGLLAARVLAKDPAGVLAELEKISVEKRPKAKAIGGNR
jgi:Rossmann-like domain